jgi:IS30 family transposase
MRGMKNYNHLTIHEREQIKLGYQQGLSCRAIAKKVGRNHRTIARELIRNSPGLGIHAYCPTLAQKHTVKRRFEGRIRKLGDGALRDYVVKRLGKGWSPETISGRLKRINSQVTVCPETIYRFIYDKENKGERYYEFLHRGHKKRELWFGRKSQSNQRLIIPNKANIALRPNEANTRETVGHLETDLMEGLRITGGAVSVTVDRKSGLVMLDKLKSKESEQRINSLIQHLTKYPRQMRKTVTMDNGTENTQHERLQKDLGCQTFFCNPYHSWEKGTVENTIGLIRSWIPKKTDLTTINQSDLNTIALELNHRPRKRLGYLTPYEVTLQETNWGSSI